MLGLVLFVPRLGAESPKNSYVEGEVLVSFKRSTSLEVSKNILRNHSLDLAKHYGLLSEKLHQPVGLIKTKNRTTAELLAELKEEPQVESVEPNYLRWTSDATVPNDPLFEKQWSLR